MRRMISEKSQQFIKSLSKSISTDGEGNLDVGKNLDVDGQLTINSASDLKTKDGTTIGGSEKWHRHTITFSESGLGHKNCFTAYSKSGTPIDTVSYLLRFFANTHHECAGTINRGAAACIRIDIGSIQDEIYFVDITGNREKLNVWTSTSPESTLSIHDFVDNA